MSSRTTWSRPLLRYKLKALGIHLSISALIFLPILYLLWTRWFPAPLFITDGGWQGMRILLFVDVALGPSLTFLIFNPNKSRREIRFDLSCIALVQAAALAFGIYTIEQKRQWVMAFYEGAFHASPVDTFQDQKLAPETWSALGEHPVYWAYVRQPKSSDETGGVAAYAMMEGMAPYQLAFLYQPLSQHWQDVRKAALTPSQSTGDIELDQRLVRYRETHPASLYYIKHVGYFRDAVLVFDEHDQHVDTLYARTAHVIDNKTQ